LQRSEISLDTGSGFKNFGTGAERKSENVTPATSSVDWSTGEVFI